MWSYSIVIGPRIIFTNPRMFENGPFWTVSQLNYVAQNELMRIDTENWQDCQNASFVCRCWPLALIYSPTVSMMLPYSFLKWRSCYGSDVCNVSMLLSEIVRSQLLSWHVIRQMLPQETTYFENIANIWNAEVKDRLKKVNERVDKTE